jgi:hypothetical protein
MTRPAQGEAVMALFGRRRFLDRSPTLGSSRVLLSPPSLIAFAISAVLALVALLIRYTDIRVPIVNAAYVFELLLIAYAILAISVLVGRGYGGRL